MRASKMLLSVLIAVSISMVFSVVSSAQDGMKDEMRINYYDVFKGKRVVYVPMSMGFDLTAGWGAIMEKECNRLGIKFEIRDPNWNTNTGSRTIASLIEENPPPDVMVIHNFDVQSYAQLLKRATRKGIKVVQVNMRSTTQTDAFVGVDWVGVGEAEARVMINKIGKGTNTSHKLAILQGELTSASSLFTLYGIMDVLKDYEDIEIVANQPCDWDANKCHDITQTILQQHPDLAGIIGFWDGQDVGIGAAVQEAKKEEQVLVVSSGGGNIIAGEAIKKGLIDVEVVFDVRRQGYDLMDAIKMLLQTNFQAGTQPFALYTPLRLLTKENVNNKMSYWDLPELKENDPTDIIKN